jgi:hypothetical protein
MLKKKTIVIDLEKDWPLWVAYWRSEDDPSSETYFCTVNGVTYNGAIRRVKRVFRRRARREARMIRKDRQRNKSKSREKIEVYDV